MRKLYLAALAAIVFLCPLTAFAQQQSATWEGPYLYTTRGALTTITTDRLTIGLSGTAWTTASFKVITAGTATVTAQYSNDGAVNWLAAPFAKRLSTVNANPTVQSINATTLTTGDVWEIPLPGNATHVSLLCAATGTTTTIDLGAGQPYSPGSPSVAVLFDTTSASNTAIDTGTFDLAGWRVVSYTFTMSGGAPAFAVAEVDDSGTALASIITATAALTGGLGIGATVGGTAGLAAAASQIPLPRRAKFTSAQIAAQTSRVRITASR